MKKKLKVYLAGGISDTPRKNYQKEMAKKIRKLGYQVYAASENDSINDKSNDPEPIEIYSGDIEHIKKSDIFTVCISGGNEDGTLSEIGFIAGWNEYEYLQKNKLNKHYEPYKPIQIIAYTTNERLMQPQFWNTIPSGGFNHLIAGMIDRWGKFVGGEQDLLKYLEEINVK